MKAFVTGRVLIVKDSKDREGNPEKTAVIMQDGESYPDQILNVSRVAEHLKEGEQYTFPVVVIPYINKRTQKAGLLAVLDEAE